MSAFQAIFRNLTMRGAQGLIDVQKDFMKVAQEDPTSRPEIQLAVNTGIHILGNINSQLCLLIQSRSRGEVGFGATTDNPLQGDSSNTSTSAAAATEANLVADEVTPPPASSASANIAPNSLGTGSNAGVSCATSQPQTTTTTTAPPLPAAANTAAVTGPAASQPGSTASAITGSPLRRERNAFLIPVTSKPGRVVGPIHVPPEGGFFDVLYVRDPPPSVTPAAPIPAQVPVASNASTSSGTAALPATSGDSEDGSDSDSPAPSTAASSDQLETEDSMTTSTSSQTSPSVAGDASPVGNRTPKRTRDSEDDEEEVARPSSRQRREPSPSPSPSSSSSNVPVRRSPRRHSSRE